MFDRPSLANLIDRNAATMQAETGSELALARRNNLNVLARVNAGAVHGLYGHLAWQAQQQFPDTAESEYLRRWADCFDLAPVEAGFARAVVQLQGNVGANVPAGTRLAKQGGLSWLTDAAATLLDGTALVAITAELAGAASSVASGETLRLVSPVAGVASAAIVQAAGLISGADAETDSQLAQRVLARLRDAPHGGARHDYIAWAKQLPGITRVWPLPRWLADGNVGVAFVRDNDPDGIIPTPAEVAALQTLLNASAPLNAHPVVFAPTAVAVDIALKITPDTPTTRAAVAASLADLFAHEATLGGLMRVTHIHQVISDTPGEVDHELASPTADVFCLQNEIATLGSITWL